MSHASHHSRPVTHSVLHPIRDTHTSSVDHITAHTRTRLRHGHKRAYIGLSPGLHTPCTLSALWGRWASSPCATVAARSATTFRDSRDNQRGPRDQSSFQKLHRGCGKCSSRPEKPVCEEARARARARAEAAASKTEPRRHLGTARAGVRRRRRLAYGRR